MGLKDIIEEILKRKTKNKMQERIQAVKEEYDEGETEREAIQRATDRVMKEIEDHPDMPVKNFLKMIQEEEKLSTDIVVEATKQISDVKSEETVAEIIEEIDLSSKGIQEIIKQPGVSIETAKKMAEQIPDITIQKQERQRLEKIERQRREAQKKEKENELKEQLKEKYKNCVSINAVKLIGELREIQKQSENPEIHDMIKQVLAMKAAIEWRQRGTTRIPSMTTVIPPEELLESDFSGLVRKDFDQIKEYIKSEAKKDYQYEEEDLQNLILAEIAKKVASIYNRVEIIDIPESEKMKELTKEQEEKFIAEILKFVEEKRKAINVERIRNQIRGIQDNELEELKELVERIPEEERKDYIKRLKLAIQKGRQEPLAPEIEDKLTHLREELKDLDITDAVEVLENAREDIKDRKVQTQLEGTTQEEEEYLH